MISDNRMMIDVIDLFNVIGNYVFGIFLDSQRAFDIVNHDILLQNLQCYGI